MINVHKPQTLRRRIFLSSLLQTATSILLIGVISSAITLSILKIQAFGNINSIFDDVSDKINKYSENIFNLSQSLMYDSNLVDVLSFDKDMNKYSTDTINDILSSNPDILAIKLTIDGSEYTVSQGRNSMYNSGSIGYLKAANLPDKLNKNAVWYVTYSSNEASDIFFIRKICDPYTGDERGTILFQINARVFHDMSTPTEKLGKGEFCILSDNNLPISNSFDIPDGTMQRIIERKNGTDSTPGKYFMYSALSDLNWELVYRADKWNIYKIVYLLFILTLLLCSLAIVAAVYFTNTINKSVVIPISELENSMLSWNENDVFHKPHEYTTREVNILYDGFETMTQKVNSLINTNYKQALIQRESELKMLQSQINPHFIFNTLESINSFAAIYDAEEISDITMALASLIEEGIGYHSDSVHTLSDEVALVEDYLTIMRIRYGDRITIQKDIDDTLLKTPMPSLILQPIVENAVLHGLIPLDKNGILTIRTFRGQNDVCICICDNGIGIPAEKLTAMNDSFITDKPFDGKSIGLTNVNKRLKLLYGDSYHIHISNEPQGGTCVLIKIALNSSNNIAKEDNYEV